MDSFLRRSIHSTKSNNMKSSLDGGSIIPTSLSSSNRPRKTPVCTLVHKEKIAPSHVSKADPSSTFSRRLVRFFVQTCRTIQKIMVPIKYSPRSTILVVLLIVVVTGFTAFTRLAQRHEHRESSSTLDWSTLKQIQHLASGRALVTAGNKKSNIAVKDDAICRDYEKNHEDCFISLPDRLNQNDICLLTQKGQKGSLPNQDFIALFRYAETPPDPPLLLMSLFDGHGDLGHQVAQAAQIELPWRISNKLAIQHSQRNDPSATPLSTEDIIQETFLEFDREDFIRSVPSSGSTAVIILYYEAKLYLASLGDSTAFCAHYNNTSSSEPPVTTILAQAVRHKPVDAAERQRIERAGGTVFLPSPLEIKNGASSRVIIPQHVHSKTGQGVAVQNSVALAMSRSLGDEDGKVPGYLLAEPSIQVIDLPAHVESNENIQFNQQNLGNNYFCVAASDGLNDIISVEQIARRVGHSLFGGKDEQHETDFSGVASTRLGKTCQDLVSESVDGWAKMTFGKYRDDISIVVSKIIQR